ncbi:MAG: glycosyltransferase [Bacteroidota bacterium]
MSNKQRIVIASTLKPADDIRSFRKIGVSLGKTNNYEVKILGAGGKVTSAYPNVTLMPYGKVSRLSIKRFFLPFHVLRKVLSIRPDLLIIETHELLIPACLYKILYPAAKVVYDVRENYATNIRSQQIFYGPARYLLASWIRLKELISFNFLDLLFIAEKGYQSEYPALMKHPNIVLQNTSLLESSEFSKYNKQPKRFIFTGNLSVNSGVDKAINVFLRMAANDSTLKLLIIGHSPSAKFLDKLKKRIQKENRITLIGGDQLVDHSVITDHLKKAHIGMVTYQLNDSNRNCMPTKVFEYLSIGLPIICEKNTGWYKLAHQYGMAFPSNQPYFNYQNLQDWYKNLSPNFNKQSFSWQNDEKLLLEAVGKLLPKG